MMRFNTRAICTAAAVGILGIGVTGCNSSSKDSKKPTDKMEKMDDKMDPNMKMDEKAK